MPCFIEVDNRVVAVQSLFVAIWGRVSNGDKKIDLVQHTSKRDKGPQGMPEPRPIKCGGNADMSGIESTHKFVTFERVQFKTATANNVKRRAAQQFYVVEVELLAQSEDGVLHRVASSNSAPLVVRGRSPGHYAESNQKENVPKFNMNQRHINQDSYETGNNYEQYRQYADYSQNFNPLPNYSIPVATASNNSQYGNSSQNVQALYAAAESQLTSQNSSRWTGV